MRIAANEIPIHMTANVQESLRPVQSASQQLSTGKRVNMPSDDPLAAGKIVDVHSELSRDDSYLQSADTVDAQLAMSASILGRVHTLMVKAQNYAIEGLNQSTESPVDRATLAASVDAVLQQTVALANTRHQGESLFAGFQTQATPFDMVSGQDGAVQKVEYKGDEGVNHALVGDQMAFALNLPGDAVFQSPGASVFDSLIELRNALNQGDERALDGALDQVQAAMGVVSMAQAHAGSLEKALETRKDALGALESNLHENLSTNEDADMAKTAADYQQALNVYNAGIQSTAMISKLPTVINYL
jgi:flagellar hook-associated protein 3 FlgL